MMSFALQPVSLAPEALRRTIDPARLGAVSTADLEPVAQLIGQERAVEAVRFGLSIRRQGYNLFVLGPSGLGKHTLVRGFLAAEAQASARPPDWCYVHNFEQPDRPRALKLPPGRGIQLRDAMHKLADEAVAAITAAPARYQAFLLAGVTGSGKTEVYLHCVARALADGRQALVLVPEINLTPQLAEAFARRFPGAHVVTLTSAVAANERAEAWLAAQSGAAQIVLGTRLAVFAPLPSLGLVVVDEEQDSSFKQQDGVRYSARDLAVYRAHAAGVPIVLGSATPSLESWTHARSGRYRLLELKERARSGSRLPEVRLVDARVDRAVDGLSAARADARRHASRGTSNRSCSSTGGYAPVSSAAVRLDRRLRAARRISCSTPPTAGCAATTAGWRRRFRGTARSAGTSTSHRSAAGRSGSRRRSPRASRARACCASTATRRARRAAGRRCAARSRAATPTSSAARRSSPRATTSRGSRWSAS
jgi:hypothetical protein